MTHEELVTRVAIAMRTKREAVLERPLSRCWDELARVAVAEVLNDVLSGIDYVVRFHPDFEHADVLRDRIKGEPA